ncbi:hypothetical protein JIQ42_04200 [Leishmania sp. Namibia]|uniref:hypothetical protein n=1 Tax=Leishmania sp. Namibia TaxID=2802991 RepID=UPI001B49A155|nr:hypothetical protein JIQ42_04200 [Leishmania sp. Namibia]
MPPKRKEDQSEVPADTFRYPDGSVYEGKYGIKQGCTAEAVSAGAVTSSPSTAAKKYVSAGSVASPATAASLSAPATLNAYMHGYGILNDSSSGRYEGEWRNGVMEGVGALWLPSGGYYTGEFARNEFHGTGRYVWADGSYYEGEWCCNQMHGLGVYVDSTGKRWHGTFAKGNAAQLVAKVEL